MIKSVGVFKKKFKGLHSLQSQGMRQNHCLQMCIKYTVFKLDKIMHSASYFQCRFVGVIILVVNSSEFMGYVS